MESYFFVINDFIVGLSEFIIRENYLFTMSNKFVKGSVIEGHYVCDYCSYIELYSYSIPAFNKREGLIKEQFRLNVNTGYELIPFIEELNKKITIKTPFYSEYKDEVYLLCLTYSHKNNIIFYHKPYLYTTSVKIPSMKALKKIYNNLLKAIDKKNYECKIDNNFLKTSEEIYHKLSSLKLWS